jgi:hypothetical protein
MANKQLQGIVDFKDISKESTPKELKEVMSLYYDNRLKGTIIDFYTGNTMINHSDKENVISICLVKNSNKCIYSVIKKSA